MDIYRWMVEQEQDLLYLVEEAYGRRQMSEHTDFYVGLFTRMHQAEKTQPGFQIGDTVKVMTEDLDGQQGELRVIDPEASEGEFYGVYLESTQNIQWFAADEIEKVGK